MPADVLKRPLGGVRAPVEHHRSRQLKSVWDGSLPLLPGNVGQRPNSRGLEMLALNCKVGPDLGPSNDTEQPAHVAQGTADRSQSCPALFHCDRTVQRTIPQKARRKATEESKQLAHAQQSDIVEKKILNNSSVAVGGLLGGDAQP